MTEDNQPNQTPASIPFLVDMSAATLFGVLFLGALIGALVVGASILLERYFIEAVFCRSADSFALCADGGSLAYNVALILVSIVGVVGLVKMSVYRPLLVVIAAAATLWNANTWLGVLPWYEMFAWLAVLCSLAYAMYAWVLRITHFIVAFFLTVALVVAARLILQI